MTEHYRPTIKCRGCSIGRLTWAEQQRQYARAIHAGLTPEEVKTLMPRCQKCTTEALHARGLYVQQPPRRLAYQVSRDARAFDLLLVGLHAAM
jgi:hypothetical protein